MRVWQVAWQAWRAQQVLASSAVTQVLLRRPSRVSASYTLGRGVSMEVGGASLGFLNEREADFGVVVCVTHLAPPSSLLGPTYVSIVALSGTVPYHHP